MVKQHANKLQMMAAASLLALAAASTPASADHDHGVIVPLVTGFALGALAYHGHRQYRPGQHGRGHSGHKTRRSYSQGGYHQRPRHSRSQGGYHQPRRKH